jgi:hypothetical protein
LIIEVAMTDEALLREALKAALGLQVGSSQDAHNHYLEGPRAGEHADDCEGCIIEATITTLEERLLQN